MAARWLTAAATVPPVLFSFACLVAVPPGFGVNECGLLWCYVLGLTVLAVDRHAPVFPPRAFAVLAVVMGALVLVTLVDVFRDLGAVLVVCLVLDAACVAGCVAWRAARIWGVR